MAPSDRQTARPDPFLCRALPSSVLLAAESHCVVDSRKCQGKDPIRSAPKFVVSALTAPLDLGRADPAWLRAWLPAGPWAILVVVKFGVCVHTERESSLSATSKQSNSAEKKCKFTDLFQIWRAAVTLSVTPPPKLSSRTTVAGLEFSSETDPDRDSLSWITAHTLPVPPTPSPSLPRHA
ncbi:unnamed protein product [Boreogadus saida]